MNHIFSKMGFILLVLTIPACVTKISDEVATAKYLEESRLTAMAFRNKLMNVQKAQLASVGAVNAVPVCKEVAPALAAEYSQDGNLLKRVSLKARNKVQGTPDAWEKEILEGFNHAQRDGKPVDNLEASTISKDANGRWFRYMKAIPTQTQCLQCHGKPNEISADMKAKLATEYPEDVATGYSAGEIRGAISIRRKIN